MTDTMTDTRGTEPARIVVGVDGSEPSKAALHWAARLAASFGADIDAVSAWQYPTSYGWTSLPTGWDPRLDMEKGLEEAIDDVFGAEKPAQLRWSVEEGNPAKVLLDRSAGALMVIVGSRGHGGFAGLLLGSVSSSVAEHAVAPVLVVHDEVGG